MPDLTDVYARVCAGTHTAEDLAAIATGQDEVAATLLEASRVAESCRNGDPGRHRQIGKVQASLARAEVGAVRAANDLRREALLRR